APFGALPKGQDHQGEKNQAQYSFNVPHSIPMWDKETTYLKIGTAHLENLRGVVGPRCRFLGGRLPEKGIGPLNRGKILRIPLFLSGFKRHRPAKTDPVADPGHSLGMV